MGMLIAAIIVALLIVILALQNAGPVTLHFLFWQAEMPLVLVIICSVLLGVLLVWAILTAKKLRDRKSPDRAEHADGRTKQRTKPVKSEDAGKNAAADDKKADDGSPAGNSPLPDAAPPRDKTPDSSKGI